MTKKKAKELMMISLDKGIELYLSTMETEEKPTLYRLAKTRLRFFSDFMHQTHGEPNQDLTVDKPGVHP
jgi:hypothetical protein